MSVHSALLSAPSYHAPGSKALLNAVSQLCWLCTDGRDNTGLGQEVWKEGRMRRSGFSHPITLCISCAWLWTRSHGDNVSPSSVAINNLGTAVMHFCWPSVKSLLFLEKISRLCSQYHTEMRCCDVAQHRPTHLQSSRCMQQCAHRPKSDTVLALINGDVKKYT